MGRYFGKIDNPEVDLSDVDDGLENIDIKGILKRSISFRFKVKNRREE